MGRIFLHEVPEFGDELGQDIYNEMKNIRRGGQQVHGPEYVRRRTNWVTNSEELVEILRLQKDKLEGLDESHLSSRR